MHKVGALAVHAFISGQLIGLIRLLIKSSTLHNRRAVLPIILGKPLACTDILYLVHIPRSNYFCFIFDEMKEIGPSKDRLSSESRRLKASAR